MLCSVVDEAGIAADLCDDDVFEAAMGQFTESNDLTAFSILLKASTDSIVSFGAIVTCERLAGIEDSEVTHGSITSQLSGSVDVFSNAIGSSAGLSSMTSSTKSLGCSSSTSSLILWSTSRASFNDAVVDEILVSTKLSTFEPVFSTYTRTSGFSSILLFLITGGPSMSSSVSEKQSMELVGDNADISSMVLTQTRSVLQTTEKTAKQSDRYLK